VTGNPNVEVKQQAEGVAAEDALVAYQRNQALALLSRLGLDHQAMTTAVNRLFERTIIEEYTQPVLEYVQARSDVPTPAEHGRRIDADRATTWRWWQKGQVPKLQTFLFTLAAFHVPPEEVLPNGLMATVKALQKCVAHVQVELKKTTDVEISLDQIVCLGLIWQSQEWKEALVLKSQGETRKAERAFQTAATGIIATLKVYVEESAIKSA
jgi:hypothetical protein